MSAKIPFRDPREFGAQCDRCPLRDSKPPVFGEGPDDATFAVVGEGPGMDEVRMGRPFIGRSGEELDAILEQTGLKRPDILVDNATLCFPPGGNLQGFVKEAVKRAKKLKEDFYHPVDCCRPRLFRRLRVPSCSKCKRQRIGPDACACHEKDWIHMGRPMSVTTIIPLGNGALRSLFGFEGIAKWRGSPINADTFPRRNVELFQKYDGKGK